MVKHAIVGMMSNMIKLKTYLNTDIYVDEQGHFRAEVLEGITLIESSVYELEQQIRKYADKEWKQYILVFLREKRIQVKWLWFDGKNYYDCYLDYTEGNELEFNEYIDTIRAMDVKVIPYNQELVDAIEAKETMKNSMQRTIAHINNSIFDLLQEAVK